MIGAKIVALPEMWLSFGDRPDKSRIPSEHLITDIRYDDSVKLISSLFFIS